jgi:hypothetical protein
MPHFFYQPTVYHLLHWRFIQEALHFLSGVIGCFIGCWTYAVIAKRKEERAAKANAAAGRKL